jgi:site-specific recombinase XerD
MKTSTPLPPLLEAFFTERLQLQLCASPNTIAAYSDSFQLLLEYAKKHLNREPSKLFLEDLDAPFLTGFLQHLEQDRKNTVRTRNLRLAAIHSFFRFVAFREPALAALIERVLAIPTKRHDRPLIAFLTPPEIDALLAAPDRSTWGGRRDHVLLAVAIETGLRVSELVGLCRQDVVLEGGAYIHCRGKGRKERCTPLRKPVAAALRMWMREQPDVPTDPLFPNARRKALSRDGVAWLLAKHTATAAAQCPSLQNKRVTPHVLRHTTAMNLLQGGVETSAIALYLGHESPETTQVYLRANLAMKQEALAKVYPMKSRARRYRPPDPLMRYLKGL